MIEKSQNRVGKEKILNFARENVEKYQVKKQEPGWPWTSPVQHGTFKT